MAHSERKAYKAKVIVGPRFDNSQGKIWVTEKLMSELKKPTIDIAIPFILLGNTSDINVHITGPREIAKDAT